RGDFMGCQSFQVTGFQEDGGYAQYMIARSEAVAALPDALSPVEAAPILCAGVTTFNSLRHSGANAGDLVAVQGLGGLGHLGVQFASKMGFHTVAIGRGQDKEALALKLGATRYLDTDMTNAANELTKMGGASVILATAPNSKSMSELIGGLGVGGKLLVVGASADPIQVTPIQPGHSHSTHRRAPIDSRLAVRNSPRLGRYAELLCADRHSPHGRDLSVRAGRGRLRSHAKR
ncbi:MAG: zinc-binding dehydrogenase, partial [Nitrospirota bacterium]